jgi:hypothetical protein
MGDVVKVDFRKKTEKLEMVIDSEVNAILSQFKTEEELEDFIKEIFKVKE